MKKCTKCGEEKGLGEFYKGDGRFGYLSMCKICHKKASTQWAKKNPEKALANARKSATKYRTLHPEENKRRKRDWYRAHKKWFCVIRRNSRYLKKYGIVPGQLETMLLEQHNRCLICNKDIGFKGAYNGSSAVVDHNHETNMIRGLLCSNCNRGMGYLKDNIEYLKNAIKYLKKYV